MRIAEGMETMQIARNTTLLDLVIAVSRQAPSESELIATVAGMVNRGEVRLCGTFKGETFDMTALSDSGATIAGVSCRPFDWRADGSTP